MSIAKQSLTKKVRISKRASFLNRTAAVMGCRVFVDHAYNIIIEGESDKVRKTFDVLKAMGYVFGRMKDIEISQGVSWVFVS